MDLPDLTLLTQGGGKMSRQLNLKFAEYCRDNGKRWIANLWTIGGDCSYGLFTCGMGH